MVAQAAAAEVGMDMLTSSIYNEISLNDENFNDKVRSGLAENGFIVLTDVALPISQDIESYIRENFLSLNHEIGNGGGRLCVFDKTQKSVPSVFPYLEDMSMKILEQLGEKFAKEIVDSKHSCMQFTRYPKSEANPQGGIILSEHVDPSMLTLTTSNGKGLTISGHSSGAVDLDLNEGKLLIFVGTALEKLSGGEYKSCFHRVQNTFDRTERLSFQFFPFPASGFNVPYLNGGYNE